MVDRRAHHIPVGIDQRVRSLPANGRLRDRRVHGWNRRLQPIDGQLVRLLSLTKGGRVRVPPQEPLHGRAGVACHCHGLSNLRTRSHGCINPLHHGQPRISSRGQQPLIQDAQNSSSYQLHWHHSSPPRHLHPRTPVPREENWRADLLSKHQVKKFLALTPGASRSATTPLSVPTLV